MEKITIYKEQLSRMRSMNRYYHDQFLLDVRILFILNTIFIYLSLNNEYALYLVPLISLFGSVILSFHAYFLIFSRNYTEFIEQKINNEFDHKILIAHELGLPLFCHRYYGYYTSCWLLVVHIRYR